MLPGGYSIAFFILVSSLQPLIEYHEATGRVKDRDRALREMSAVPSKETFDFIIVGGGTAACILARRLSQKYTVLVLEFGGEPPIEEEGLPQLAQLMKYLPQINWIYGSTIQRTSSLETGGYIVSTAGKMMGGSGSHNNVQYERGHPRDYERWANVTKDESWLYKNILKYFLRTENYHGRFTMLTGQHRRGGLLDVAKTEVTFRPDLYFSAGKELGYEVNLDPNGPQQIGFAWAELNLRKGRRMSSYTAFILPIENKRKNLVIRRYSIVTQILIEKKRAVGVLYIRHGVPRVAFASREVILSAGAYLSPIILMRSGIGPSDQMKGPPIVELPVGKNLQDHIFLGLPMISVTDKSIFTTSPGTVKFAEFDAFKRYGTGLLAAYNSMHEGFFVSSRSVAEGYPDWPDIQLYLGHGFSNGTDYLSCHPILSRQRSIGRLSMNHSTHTLEDSLLPVIDYNFFSDPTDYDVLLEAIELCQKIVNTTTFKKIGAKFIDDTPAACRNLTHGTREFWMCYIHQRASSENHLTSTIAMGTEGDPNACVDSKLRVLGIKGLRVVDASVMPFVPNSNIAAPVMMIAEKVSDDILAAWA